MTELPLDLAPPTERARPRDLQQTWLAAPGAHAATLAAPLRLSAHALRPLQPPRGDHLPCGDLTDFCQFSFHIPSWKDPEIS